MRLPNSPKQLTHRQNEAQDDDEKLVRIDVRHSFVFLYNLDLYFKPRNAKTIARTGSIERGGSRAPLSATRKEKEEGLGRRSPSHKMGRRLLLSLSWPSRPSPLLAVDQVKGPVSASFLPLRPAHRPWRPIRGRERNFRVRANFLRARAKSSSTRRRRREKKNAPRPGRRLCRLSRGLTPLLLLRLSCLSLFPGIRRPATSPQLMKGALFTLRATRNCRGRT